MGGKFSNPKSTKMQDFAWELKNKEDAISGLTQREAQFSLTGWLISALAYKLLSAFQNIASLQ